MNPSSRFERALPKIALLVVSTLLSLGAGELVVHVFYGKLVDTHRAALEQVSIRTLVQPSSNPRLFFELRPNIVVLSRNAIVATSPDGYRIPPGGGLPPRAGARRVAVLGDSTPFGWGVAYEQTYAELFRVRMEAELGTPIELRNFSVPAYNSEQELEAFRQKVVPFEPHLVIVHHDHTDADPIGTGVGITPDYMAPDYGDNILHSSLLKLLTRSVKTYRNRSIMTESGEQVEKLGTYITRGRLYDRHVQALADIGAGAARFHAPVVAVLFMPNVIASDHYESQPDYAVLHQPLAKRLESQGLYVLDLYPYDQDVMKQRGWRDLSETWVSRDPIDGHPGPSGHRLIVDALVEKVLKTPALRAALEKR